jgi:hypothetical protein
LCVNGNYLVSATDLYNVYKNLLFDEKSQLKQQLQQQHLKQQERTSREFDKYTHVTSPAYISKGGSLNTKRYSLDSARFVNEAFLNANNFRRVQFIIARNINRHLVKKNLLLAKRLNQIDEYSIALLRIGKQTSEQQKFPKGDKTDLADSSRTSSRSSLISLNTNTITSSSSTTSINNIKLNTIINTGAASSNSNILNNSKKKSTISEPPCVSRSSNQKRAHYLIYNSNNGSISCFTSDQLEEQLSKSRIKSNSQNQNSSVSSEINQNNRNQMTYRDMMVLNTEWTQLEIIELLNESAVSAIAATSTNGNISTSTTTAIAAGASLTSSGAHSAVVSPSVSASSNANRSSSVAAIVTSGSSSSASSSTGGGFGFGITGNKSTGVVVKAITPGGSAHKV